MFCIKRKKDILRWNYYGSRISNVSSKCIHARHISILSLDHSARDMGSYMSSGKIEFMYLKPKRAIFKVNDILLRSENNFTYFDTNISIEMIWNISKAKAWTVIDMLSTICIPNFTDKIKRRSFKAVVVSVLMYGCTIYTLSNEFKK